MPNLDARLEAVYRDLLRELFLGGAEAMRERLRPLTEPERAALYAALRDLLTNLPAMFKMSEQFRFETLRAASGAAHQSRAWDIDALYRRSLTEPAFFASPQWVKTVPWQDESRDHALWQSEHVKLEGLCLRHRCLALGLSPRKQVVGWFRLSRDSAFSAVPQFIVQPGLALFDRAAPWIVEALVTVAKAPQKYFPSGGAGFPQLLTEARRRFPEWNAQLEPFYADALRNERFLFPNGVTQLAPEILLAGFLADPLPEALERQMFGPMMRALFLGFCRKGLISRAQMLAAVLERLATANRPTLAGGWRQYLADLAPADEERAACRQRYLDLTGAFSSTAQFALDECAAMWARGDISTDDWTAALLAALRHVNQPVGVKAWKLLLKAARPEDMPRMADAAVEAISSPHKGLRAEVIKWLVKHPAALSAARLADIAALAPTLPAAEQERLAPLTASAGTATTPAAAPPEDRPEDSVAALAAQVAAFKSARTDAVSQKRLAFLEGFLAGAPVALEAVPPSLAGALEIDVFPYDSPDALVEGFLETGATPPTLIRYEQLLDGVQRFRDAAQDAIVRKTLDPLLKQFERAQAALENPQDDFAFWRRRQFPDGVCLLAGLWLTGQSAPRESDVQLLLAEPFGFRLAMDGFQSALGFRLALPTHHDGWLHPRVFAERLGAAEGSRIEQLDLLQALYRLPALPKARAEAWEALPPTRREANAPADWILAVALGPDDRFEAAVASLRRFFQAEPPTDFLYQLPAALFQRPLGLGRDQAAALAERRKRALSAAPNVAFRLFCAALRARFGLGDARPWAEGVPLSRLATAQAELAALLEEQAKLEYAHRTPPAVLEPYLRQQRRLWEAERACAEKVRDRWLFNPEPITRGLFRERLYEPPVASRETLLLHLSPYLCSSVGHAHAVEYENFPAGAQRFFELGVARLAPPEDLDPVNDYLKAAKFGFSPALLRAGRPGHVDVAFALDDLSAWLKSEKPPVRELVVELFHHWLRDGRAAPTALAAAVAKQLRETSKGYAYLDAALVLLSTLSESGRLLALLACETALAAPLTAMPSRSASLLLDRLEWLLGETGRAITDETARAHLTAPASAKKSSDLGAKARRLAARPVLPGQLPTEVRLAAALLSATSAI